MSNGYTKLFSDIVDSSIWNEPSDTCKVWITLLALCDQNGYVRGSVGWLAGKARVSKEKCAAALALFQQPDPESRTPDHDGRRIEQLEDGWLVLNYLAFRDRLSSNPKSVKTRERVRKWRERYIALRNASSVTCDHSASVSVSSSDSCIQGDARGGWTLDECLSAAAPIGMPRKMVEDFFNHYAAVDFIDAAGRRITNLAAALGKWKSKQGSQQESGKKNGGKWAEMYA